jgi:tetratricopeptide (TPR) repeat protein
MLAAPSAMLVLAATLLVPAQDPAAGKQRSAAEAHYARGISALGRERYEQAEREFGEAITAWPVFPMAYHGLGQARMGLKKFREALDAFLSCRDQFQQSSLDSIKDKGAAEGSRLEEIQGLRDSIAILQRNSQLATRNERTIHQMEDRIRQLESTRTEFENPAAATPAFVMLSIGSAHFRMGSLPDAEREYRNAVTADPGFGEAHNNLAVVYMLTGRLAEAEQEIALAEKAGFPVNPRLKEDVKKRLGK